MTTNVCDQSNSIMASDSRWSWDIKTVKDNLYATIYVDDADFDKIETGEEDGIIFAGDSGLIQEWKTWFRDPNRVLRMRPRVQGGFAVCWMWTAKTEPLFEHGQRIIGTDYRFAGTGAKGAYTCWKQNRDSRRAVLSAYLEDHYSGGEVKHLDLKTMQHNVSKANLARSANDLCIEKGMIMYHDKKHVPVSEAIANDPLVSDTVKKIASGAVSAQAPAGKDEVVWTDADEARLDAALAERFGKK